MCDGRVGLSDSRCGVKNIVTTDTDRRVCKEAAELKNVQIPKELFVFLVKYHLCDMYEYENDIKKGIEKKLSAMTKRQYYTKYKTAVSKEDREKARQKYLDEAGIHKDFRW